MNRPLTGKMIFKQISIPAISYEGIIIGVSERFGYTIILTKNCNR